MCRDEIVIAINVISCSIIGRCENNNDVESDVPPRDQDFRSKKPTRSSAYRQTNNHYRTLVDCPRNRFELGEHLLSKQLIFVFRGLPELDLAGALEAIGFDHTADEHTFTVKASTASRKKAVDLALQWGGKATGLAR